jgi:hypothetical protein
MMKQRLMAMLPRFFAIVAVVVILGAALGAGSALAAKGGSAGKGNGGKGHGGTTATCTTCVLTVSPNPMPVHTQPTVSGTGFAPGVNFFVRVNGDIFYTIVTPDSSGSFSFVYTYKDLYAPGTYAMVAWNGSGKAAEYTFTVTQ